MDGYQTFSVEFILEPKTPLSKSSFDSLEFMCIVHCALYVIHDAQIPIVATRFKFRTKISTQQLRMEMYVSVHDFRMWLAVWCPVAGFENDTRNKSPWYSTQNWCYSVLDAEQHYYMPYLLHCYRLYSAEADWIFHLVFLSGPHMPAVIFLAKINRMRSSLAYPHLYQHPSFKLMSECDADNAEN